MGREGKTDDGLIETDLLVIGAGMAGMTAAAHAARLGRNVIVLEKGSEIGGSAAISGGLVWTAPSEEALRDEDRGADAAWGRQLVEGLGPGLDWVRSLGVHVSEQLTDVLNFGIGSQIDVLAYLDVCRAVVEGRGGWIVRGAHVRELVVADGRVAGAVVEQEGDEPITVRAPWTLIATGGFQADPQLVRRYIEPSWDAILLRSNVHSAGDGIALGQSVGGALSDSMSGFYGHLMPHPVGRPLTESDLTAMAQFHSEHCILVAQSGRRFTDESLGDHLSSQAVAHLEGQRAVLICDERVRREHVLGAFMPWLESSLDKLAFAGEAGARYARAAALEGLAEPLSAWGYDGRQAVATVERFNETVERDATALEPGRRRNRRSLAAPPYVALEVQPGITFTYGGLRSDAEARVLDADGNAIEGLLVAGADAGGVFERGYAGGLIRGLVSGERAAKTAAGERAAPAAAERR